MKDLFGKVAKYPSFEDIINEFSKNTNNYLSKEGNVFGFWMQTLADIQFLDLELSGLTKKYSIDALNHKVELNGE